MKQSADNSAIDKLLQLVAVCMSFCLMIFAIIALVLFIVPKTAKADPLVIVQTGGYAGMVAAGPGYGMKHYSTGLLVGYVPAMVGGENLWSLSLKNQLELGPLHVGIANHFSLDRDTFWILPDKYPKKYYPPSGIKSGPYIGLHSDDDVGLFAEISTLDYYMELKARNPDFIEWKDIVSLGFGVYLVFD